MSGEPEQKPGMFESWLDAMKFLVLLVGLLVALIVSSVVVYRLLALAIDLTVR